MRYIYVSLLCLLFCAQYLPISASAQQGRLISNDSTIVSGTLPNGFSYFIAHSEEPKNKVEIRLVVKAGFMHEDKDQLHLSHVIEHLGFRSSQNFQSIAHFLQSQGLTSGIDFNASTGFRFTSYNLTIPSGKDILLKNCLLIAKDWSSALKLDSNEAKLERQIVINEISPGRRREAHFKDNYFNRDSNEEIKNIEKSTHSSLSRYYHDWYRPNLQAIIVVGNVEMKQTENLIRSMFSGLSNPINQRPWKDHQSEKQTERYLVNTNVGPGMPLSVSTMTYIKGFRVLDEMDYKRLLTIQLFNYMSEGRSKNLASQLGDKVNVIIEYKRNAFNSELDLDMLHTSIRLFGNVNKVWLKEIVQYVYNEYNNMLRKSFSSYELALAKEKLKTINNDIKNRSSREIANRLNDHFLGISNFETNTLFFKTIDDIGLEDISVALKEWKRNKITSIKVESNKEYASSVPSDSELREWMAKPKPLKILENISQPPLKPLELMTKAELQSLSKSTGYEIYRNSGFITLKMKNGVNVIYKQIENNQEHKDKVFIQVIKPGGFLQYPKESYYNAKFINGLISSSTIGNLNQSQLKNFMKASGLDLKVSMLGTYSIFSGESQSKNLELFFQLLYGFIKNLKVDGNLFQNHINEYKQFGNTSGKTDSINRVYQKQPLPFPPPLGFDYNTIDESDVLAIYKKHFSEMNDITITLVGDLEIDSIAPMISKYVMGICTNTFKSSKQVDNLKSHPSNKAVAYQVIKNQPQDEAICNAIIVGNAEFNYKNKVQLDLLNVMLKNLLFRKIREELGGTFNITTAVDQSVEDKFRIRYGFRCKSVRVDELCQASWDVIESLKKNGPERTLLNSIVEQERLKFRKRLNEPNFWQDYLNRQILNGCDLNEIDSIEKIYSEIDVDNIKDFVKNCFNYKTVEKLREL